MERAERAFFKDIIGALLEKEEYGQLSPETMHQLKENFDCLITGE